MSPVSQYLSDVQKTLRTGDAREHAYRPAFQRLIESLVPGIQAINEPAYTGSNAPDFLFKRGEIPVSYAECKDVSVDISDKEVQKQAKRYIDAFGKILLTNYLEFRVLDESGEVTRISIATKSGTDLVVHEQMFRQFESLIRDFITPTTRTIRSAKKLAEIMASKARLLRDNSLAALRENTDSEISLQYNVFREVLIRDLTIEEFADMYAQTLVYGLFVARYFDKSLADFSRHEAHDLLPSTNPLLKKFFGHVAGTDFDPKVAWMVDGLIEAYKSADVRDLMRKEFEKQQKDPILHFYETFLSEYDKDLRKSRGVYYTPEPVVSFIVRSVDYLLKSKFNLQKGLADTTKIEHEFSVQGSDGRTKDGSRKVREQIHKVQILDPALGTGTFLNEVIREIHKAFVGQEGRWSGYVEKELLPRLHGFELMMASYTMAHLKLGVTLRELGYEGVKERLSVWLTNSLEESVHEVPNLFMSQWLTNESNEASKIKSEMPVMVVIGNPPYSIKSFNKGDYIRSLISVYKKDLNEKKINLDDDYIKFIRFAEHAVERTGYGIVAMITNNSFIDGVTHRQMRKHLMETFDEVYILNLHGDAQRDSGNSEENVFTGIKQGVSINIFVKTRQGGDSARVYYADLYGKQTYKFEKLNELSIDSLAWKELVPEERYAFFVPKNFEAQVQYEKGFKVDELILSNNTGIQTKNDAFTISFSESEMMQKIEDIKDLTDAELEAKYGLNDKGVWKLSFARRDIQRDKYIFQKILYRPFDYRFTAYTEVSSGFLARPRHSVSQHFLSGNNLGLVTLRLNGEGEQFVCLITNTLVEKGSLPRGNYSVFPLYLNDSNGIMVSNLNRSIWEEINKVAGNTTPEDILDYTYAILHSSVYREVYKEFLKIDFPRIPYPQHANIFWKLVALGRELRELHLLTHSQVGSYVTIFPVSGNNVIEKKYPLFRDEKVYINDTQYFGGVPREAWEFFIGGYQPAQKWLKDRRGRVLTDDEIDHYQRVIVSLVQTGKLMKEIDSLM